MKTKLGIIALLVVFLLFALSIYVSEVSGATIYYAADGKVIVYHKFVNGSTGIERYEYGDSKIIIQNEGISFTVEIFKVDTGGGFTDVFLNISVAGSSDVMKYSHGNFYGYVKPYMVVINASQGDVPRNAMVGFYTAADRGYNVYGEKKDPHNDTVNDFMKLGVSYAAGVLINSGIGVALDLLEIMPELLGSTGIHDVLGARGPYKTATMVLYQRGYKTYDNPDTSDNWWSKMGYTAYAMHTQIIWELPTSEKSYTLHLSVQNIMGKWMEMFPLDNIDDYPPTQTWYSAKSMIDITIKNGQIKYFDAHTENVDGESTTTFYTKDYTPSWESDELSYYVSPVLRVRASTYNSVPLNYEVDWGDGTNSSVYNVPSGEYYPFNHNYYPRRHVGESRSYTIRIRAYTADYYGGWSETKTIDITVINNGKMNDDGGGGGCPFLYTYSGDNWREENNVLVWAENATRPFLETGDFYLFNATENNDRVTIGIGEPGEDADYIDAVKLYKVNAPEGYEVAESYTGMVYAYREVESGIAKDNHGENVTLLIGEEDGNYWIGDKGDYVDITLNLSSENLLVIRGIDNPQESTGKLRMTRSTILVYANVSNEWIKLGEIKVRHNLHTNVVNLDLLHLLLGDKVELRFEMRDRNGIDFIGVAHDYRLASLERVNLEYSSYGYENITEVDGNYLRLNPGDFVRLSFESEGDGLYLLAIYGFYFNHEMIGKGIGIARADEVNIAEAKLQGNLSAGVNYVLLPLLENYNGICSIMWYVDGTYVPGDKPVVSFDAGVHTIELRILRSSGAWESYSLQLSIS